MIVVKDNGLTEGSKISTIKVMAEYNQNHKEVKALYVLLGGYNKLGRHIDLEVYKEKKRQFDSLIQDLAESF